MVSKIQEPFLHKECENCEIGYMKEPSSSQEWHLVCNECGAIKFCYQPQGYQRNFHRDSSKYKGFFGGRKSVAA